VDTSHGLVRGGAYRSEEKRIPLLVACREGELAVAQFLVEVSRATATATTDPRIHSRTNHTSPSSST
jgi:hypothetical protein